MSLLFNVVYAAHANGTHHKLALDALNELRGPDADLWLRLFLKHVKSYLEASKAPDNEFKDFKNHVLHVRDGYWGGAPEKAQNWYAHLVEALERQDWPQAVYCAGILSHYVTDPIHPFHTGQSVAETNVHRAVEWSISKSYNALRLRAVREGDPPAIDVPEGKEWLAEMLCTGAERSNRFYEDLILHYDIHKGVVDPPEGLDDTSRRFVGDLIRYASALYARVLDKAVAEAGVKPPDVGLTIDTVLATLQIPTKWLTKKLADASERKLVEAMYDELKATGRVAATLDEENRALREHYQSEGVAAPARPAVAERFPVKDKGPSQRPELPRAKRLESTAEATKEAMPKRRPFGFGRSSAAVTEAPTPSDPPPKQKSLLAALRGNRSAEAKTQELVTPELEGAEYEPPKEPLRLGQAEEASRIGAMQLRETAAAMARVPSIGQIRTPRDTQPARLNLNKGDPLEDAPSIGPRTAERFAAVGITTVGEFLDEDAASIAERIGVSYISEEVLRNWQDQARLVCTVPGLRGTHAQYIVGAGPRTAKDLADADPDGLHGAIARFHQTPEAQRQMRLGDAPTVDAVRGWVASARTVVGRAAA